MSRLDWWELEQSIDQENEKELLSQHLQAFDKPISSPNTESTSFYPRDASNHEPRRNISFAVDGEEETDFETALQRNLRGCGPRFEFFLERCTWRVEDMLAEGRYTLTARTTPRDVESYIDDPSPPENMYLVVANNDSWTQTQAALVQDIDRLLPPPKQTQSLIGANVEKVRKVTIRGGSGLPKLVQRAMESKQVSKTVSKSQISTGIRGDRF